MYNTIQSEVIADILEERKRQDAKWGTQKHLPETWIPIIMEEIGEGCKEILEGNRENAIKEFTQTAAVIVNMLECMKECKDNFISITNLQQENTKLKATLAILKGE
jgi:NTP pyrophosphatase (non-canonical NTP hydrolase)